MRLPIPTKGASMAPANEHKVLNVAKYTANEIMMWRVMKTDEKGRNVPARSLDHKSDWVWQRIKWAFGVITGRYDVLDWKESEALKDE